MKSTRASSLGYGLKDAFPKSKGNFPGPGTYALSSSLSTAGLSIGLGRDVKYI